VKNSGFWLLTSCVLPHESSLSPEDFIHQKDFLQIAPPFAQSECKEPPTVECKLKLKLKLTMLQVCV